MTLSAQLNYCEELLNTTIEEVNEWDQLSGQQSLNQLLAAWLQNLMPPSQVLLSALFIAYMGSGQVRVNVVQTHRQAIHQFQFQNNRLVNAPSML